MLSPWTIVRTPMVLVVIPQEFWYASCFSPGLFGSSNTISNILEKFWPRWWDVAPWVGKMRSQWHCTGRQGQRAPFHTAIPGWLGRWQRWTPPRWWCNPLQQTSPSPSSSPSPQGWPSAPRTPSRTDPGSEAPLRLPPLWWRRPCVPPATGTLWFSGRAEGAWTPIAERKETLLQKGRTSLIKIHWTDSKGAQTDHDVAPLVEFDWQVSVWLDPFRVGWVHHCNKKREKVSANHIKTGKLDELPSDEWNVEPDLFHWWVWQRWAQPAQSFLTGSPKQPDINGRNFIVILLFWTFNRASIKTKSFYLWGKVFDVRLLFLQGGLRDKHGEVAVLHSQLLDLAVKELFNRLPDGEGPGSQHVAAADVVIFNHLCLGDDLQSERTR